MRISLQKKHGKYGFVSKRGIYRFLRHPQNSRNIITWNLNGNFKQDSHETKTYNSGDQKHHESLALLRWSDPVYFQTVQFLKRQIFTMRIQEKKKWTINADPWPVMNLCLSHKWGTSKHLKTIAFPVKRDQSGRIFWIPRFRKVTFNRWGRLPKLATAKSDQLACSMGLEECRPQGCPKRSVLNYGKFVPISASQTWQTQPPSIFVVWGRRKTFLHFFRSTFCSNQRNAENTIVWPGQSRDRASFCSTDQVSWSL